MDIDQVLINIHLLIQSLRSTSIKQVKFSSLMYKREHGILGPKRNFQTMARTARGWNQTTSVSPRSFVAKEENSAFFWRDRQDHFWQRDPSPEHQRYPSPKHLIQIIMYTMSFVLFCFPTFVLYNLERISEYRMAGFSYPENWE